MTNEYGKTPLQLRAYFRIANIISLLELGAKVNANNKNGTALHCAAQGNAANNVNILLSYGADVDALAPYPFIYSGGADSTPLEYNLFFCSNIDIINTLETAKVLLDAGAVKTERMKGLVTKIGTQFEHARPGFNKDSVQEYSDALDELYALFDVPPVPRRVLHDGKSKITLKGDTWQKQFNELWELLIPSSGAAQTLQGEVIRIAGRISDELGRNGGINWDNDYKVMADTFLEFIQQGKPLSAEEIEKATKIVGEVKRKNDNNADVLAQLAVTWVLNNPIPVKLPEVKYDR